MSRATESSLGDLHSLVADTLTAEINAYKARGEAIPPALLAQALKFLKDNGIDQPLRTGNKVDTLKKAMPDFDDDNVVPFSTSR